MPLPQPQDEWTFLRPEEFTDDGDLDAITADAERGPEERAMHVETIAAPHLDPGRSDVVHGPPGADDDEMPVTYFDDEEPEFASSSLSPEDDHEPDIEDLLESQHYSFDPSATA